MFKTLDPVPRINISISIFNVVVEGLYDHLRKHVILNTMIMGKILLRASKIMRERATTVDLD